MTEQPENQSTERLRRELQKGLDSGISNMSLDDIWHEARKKLGLKSKPRHRQEKTF